MYNVINTTVENLMEQLSEINIQYKIKNKISNEKYNNKHRENNIYNERKYRNNSSTDNQWSKYLRSKTHNTSECLSHSNNIQIKMKIEQIKILKDIQHMQI